MARVLFGCIFFVKTLIILLVKHVSGQNAAILHGSTKQLSLCGIFSRHQVGIWTQYSGVREMVLANRVVTGSYIKQSCGLCVSANCFLIIIHPELMQRKWSAWGPPANTWHTHILLDSPRTKFKFIFARLIQVIERVVFGQAVSQLGAFYLHVLPLWLALYSPLTVWGPLLILIHSVCKGRK